TGQSCAFLFNAACLAHSGLEPFFPPFAPALDFSLTFCRHLPSYSLYDTELMPYAGILGAYASLRQQSAVVPPAWLVNCPPQGWLSAQYISDESSGIEFSLCRTD